MSKYDEKIKLKWKEERENLMNEINATNQLPNWLEEKIKKLTDRTFLDEKYVNTIKELLVTDNNDIKELLLTFLMKDPKRQNIYERVFYEEIQNAGFNIKKLNSNGKKACYIFKDQILTGSEIISNGFNKPKELKSLDFSITLDNHTIYIVNKYTNENGGAQDNQYNDVITQLKEIGDLTENKVWFCLDGKYYTKQKIDALKKINNNAVILNLESLTGKLKEKDTNKK